MAGRRARSRFATIALAVLGAALGLAAIGAAVRLGRQERGDPARCPPGLAPRGPRCCAPGQVLSRARCAGAPTSCPAPLEIAPDRAGCLALARRVVLPGGRLDLSLGDFEGEPPAAQGPVQIAPFALDTVEVTVARWQHCVVAGECRALDPPAVAEPGLPVTSVDPREAARFCRFEQGRLPTSGEWLLAATGTDARRFPWGPAGLVCRRAAFGLAGGPCAEGGGPEVAGARPEGATPEGIFDLSGNVAEWTLEPDGRAVARGGSFRSASPTELRAFAAEVLPAGRAAHVGLRCAYDVR